MKNLENKIVTFKPYLKKGVWLVTKVENGLVYAMAIDKKYCFNVCKTTSLGVSDIDYIDEERSKEWLVIMAKRAARKS